jgi:uncharacterized protein YidB (DUF937 family)
MSRGFPSMTALLALVAVAGYQNRDKLAEMFRRHTQGSGQSQTSGQSNSNGGLGNILGSSSATTSQGVGGFLSSGLSELMQHFQQKGKGDVAQSWVNSGPNQAIAPDELAKTLGPDVLADLSSRTGLSEPELLARLSQHLPTAVDKYTPEGQLPS